MRLARLTQINNERFTDLFVDPYNVTISLHNDDVRLRKDGNYYNIREDPEIAAQEINAALTYKTAAQEINAAPIRKEKKAMIEAVKDCLNKNQNTLLIGLGMVLVDHFLLKGKYQSKIKQTLINLLTEKEEKAKKED